MIEQTLLRNFAAAEVEQNASAQEEERTWQWAPGVILFPEAICPFCRGTMRSNRIWLLNGSYVLRGQLRFQRVGNQYGKTNSVRAIFEEPNHPHVDEGSICTGDTDDPVEALFLGMYPTDSFWGRDRSRWRNFLEKLFDHKCPEVESHTTDEEDGEWCDDCGEYHNDD